MKKLVTLCVLATLGILFTAYNYYPIDGYAHTGIKRLKRLELIKSGELKDPIKIPEGALKNYMEIELNLKDHKSDSVHCFLKLNEKFQKDINGLFYGLDKSYSIAVCRPLRIESEVVGRGSN